MALNRRGVALEMANILPFTTHSAWVDRLMAARLDPVPDTHVVPNIQQLLSADRKLFQVLSEGLKICGLGSMYGSFQSLARRMAAMLPSALALRAAQRSGGRCSRVGV